MRINETLLSRKKQDNGTKNRRKKKWKKTQENRNDGFFLLLYVKARSLLTTAQLVSCFYRIMQPNDAIDQGSQTAICKELSSVFKNSLFEQLK